MWRRCKHIGILTYVSFHNARWYPRPCLKERISLFSMLKHMRRRTLTYHMLLYHEMLVALTMTISISGMRACSYTTMLTMLLRLSTGSLTAILLHVLMCISAYVHIFYTCTCTQGSNGNAHRMYVYIPKHPEATLLESTSRTQR